MKLGWLRLQYVYQDQFQSSETSFQVESVFNKGAQVRKLYDTTTHNTVSNETIRDTTWVQTPQYDVPTAISYR